MAVLDNFKNFIRHGKTAREGNGSDLIASSSGANLSNRQQQALPPLPTKEVSTFCEMKSYLIFDWI